MKFYTKNFTRSVFSHPKENLIILFDLILTAAAVFVLIQNYYFLKAKHDEFFSDDRVAKTYQINADENLRALIEADLHGKSNMYDIGLKLYEDINSTSMKTFQNKTDFMSIGVFYDESTIEKMKESGHYRGNIEVYQFSDHEFDGMGLKISDGRFFSKYEFDHPYSIEQLPIIMGANFKETFNIGDRIVYEHTRTYDEAVVIGFLEKNAVVEYYGITGNLDDVIIVPDGSGFPRRDRISEKYFADHSNYNLDYYVERLHRYDEAVFRNRIRTLISGYLYCPDENIDVQKEINKYTSKYGFYQLTVLPIDGTAFSETKSISERNMLLIGVLAAATTVICMISLGGVLYNRSLDDRRTYCIYISAGIPIWKINLSLILEMIFWMVISLMPVIALSLYEFQTLMIPIWQIAIFEIIVMAVSIAPSLRVNTKCNLDLLIRNQMN